MSAKKNKKKRGVFDFAYRIIVLCLIGIILVSGYNVGKSLYGYWSARNAYKKVAEIAKVDPNQFTGVIDFDSLKAVNPDVQAWIYQKDTIINYPVVQGSNNDKYLHTNLEGKYSASGAIFVDAHNAADFRDFNTIVYGHHMHDGSMFKSLRGYTKEDNYYEGHKTLELITPTEKYHLVVFSAYITKSTSDAYTYQFADAAAKERFLAQAKANSAITTDEVKVTSADRVITLSTCAYDYEEARYVIVCKMVPWTAKEIKAGEKLQKRIDAQK